MTDVSVVVPTFRRPALLDRCLECLARQSISRDRFEVLVCDDASGDETPSVVERWKRTGLLTVSYLAGRKGFAGAARNRGVREATGRRILFLGDDVLADPDLVAAHLDAERRHGAHAAFVGEVRLTGDPRTPFMEFLVATGMHHDYPTLRSREGEQLPGWYFYACNASVPRAAHLAVGGFDETILRAYEDGEYGWRLVASGVPLFFVADAGADHVHPIGVSGYVRFLRSGRDDIARVTRRVVEKGEPPPAFRKHPIVERIVGDRLLEAGAGAIGRLDRFLPRSVRWSVYSRLIAEERRRAYLASGIEPRLGRSGDRGEREDVEAHRPLKW